MLRDTNNSADHQTFKSVCDMMELYLDYFEKGHKMLRKLIPSLMKYRNMIAQEVRARARCSLSEWCGIARSAAGGNPRTDRCQVARRPER